jgi:hypothetical protein
MLESTITLPATHISNPWTQSNRTHKTRNVASNSAYEPSSLLQRLRAYSNLTLKFGFTLLSLRVCAGSAIQRGQSIDTGQAAASIHRMHHSNERRVGGSKIGHAEEHVSAACTVLSPCYLLPPDAFSRHKLLAPGPTTCYQCPSRPPPSKEREKTAQNSPRKPCGSR